jgi:hypothetical protein
MRSGNCVLFHRKELGIRRCGKSGIEGLPYLTKEIKDLEGIPGQGATNPDSIFGKHFIDKAKGTEETLYDPSYGVGALKAATKAEVFLKYQEESIGGYCRNKAPEACQKPEAKPQAKKLEENYSNRSDTAHAARLHRIQCTLVSSRRAAVSRSRTAEAMRRPTSAFSSGGRARGVEPWMRALGRRVPEDATCTD